MVEKLQLVFIGLLVEIAYIYTFPVPSEAIIPKAYPKNLKIYTYIN